MSTLRILCLVFFIAAGALYNNLHATHSMGADLTYKCLGGNTYRLRLSFYRDCSGIAAPANVTINIQSASCGLSLTKRLYPIAGTGQEITPLCTSATSTCNGGTYTGITEWIYEGDVTLPAQCADWDFSYNLCCRNGAINTIVNPLNEQIYIHSTLNNLINPCNNSPVFMNKPVPFVCAGQQFCYNHGAYDSDGDSLAYSLINPLGTGGLPVTYIAPYSANQPINSVPAMTFDSLTGTFCATPQLIEVTVMAVLVKEYRNGVLIGQVERDMQITVTPCTNMLPQLTGINGTGSFNATICANQTYCFDIFSNDPDSGQQLNVTWDHSIPSGTLATAGSPHPVSTFCWTPTLADVSFTPHCFTVKIEDDACPYIGSQIFCYCLTVVNNIADAGPDKTVHCGGTATINGSGTTTNGTISYLWSNGVTTASQAVGPGTYILTVTNGSCQVSDTVNVILIPDVTAAFNASPVCVFSPTNFYDASTTLVGNITSWSWSFGDGSTSTIQNPTHQYAAAGTYNVRLIAFNNLGCMDTIFQTVTVLPQPVAGYMVNNACAGSAFNIINTSVASGIASYNWNFGNGLTSTLNTPPLSYPNAGTYLATLIVTDGNGCKDTSQQQITAFPIPNAAFTITGGGLCQGGNITVTDNSIGNINTWNWNFGNGQYSSQQNGAANYTLPGPYDITLIISSDKGCFDTITQQVNISMPFIATPVATQSVCPGASATLTASGGVTYLWSNGSTNASITVFTPGNTTYIVTVTDSKGCTDTTQANVIVNSAPVINITAPASFCYNQQAVLSASGASTYNWQPSGINGQSITVSPNLTTTYTVTGTDVNGCTSTSTHTLTVIALPSVTLTSPVICPGSTVALDAANPGSTYTWSSGQTTQSVAISTPGTYAVTVTNSSGCSASAQTNITASALIPNVQQLTVCAGISATFNAANPNCNYLWSNGNSNQQLTVTTAGTYTVTVTDANGCTLSFASQLNVNPKPVINFSHSLACSNLPVSFANSTSISSGSITLYEWDFGDGTYSTSNSPVHQYALPGNYFVKLKATSNLGCTDSLIVPLSINTPPVASFSAVNNCLGNPTQITNSSTSYPGSTFSWSFGNGAASTAIQPVISYTNPGNYTISLIVTEASGCTDTTSNSITIYNLPQVAITAPQAICDGQSATLTANEAAVYSWQPAGGSSQSISVMPILSTIYTVTGTDLNGCSATATTALTVNPLPVVTLASPVICPASSVTLNVGNSGSAYLWSTGETTQSVVIMQPGNYSVTVTDIHGCSASGQTTLQMSQLTGNTQYFTACNGTVTTLDAANSGCNFIWSNGATTQLLNITNTGTYTVTVTDSYGCTLSFSSQLLVNPKPVPAFAAGNVCINDTTSFTNSSTISGGNIISYQWDFGDGITSVDISPSHVYALAGKYIARLIAISDSGCIADKIDTVEVYEKPISDFSAAQVCEGSSTNFINNSSIASGSINSYSWNFGDSSSVSTALSPTHLYAQFGTYQVSLITVSNYGCRDTSNKPISVNPNPVAGFTLNQQKGCGPLLVQFTDLSKIIIGTVNQWNWNFGDGTTSTLQNPAHTYNNPGTYNVSLTIHSDKGCSDVIVFNSAVTVYPNPVAAFEANTFETNILQDIHFENQSTGAINYDWNFGDGSLSNVTNPVHQYSTDGTYAITLIATNQYGCTSQARHEIIIVPIWTLYIPNAFTPDNDGVNDEFNLKGIGIENYNLRIFNRWGDLIFEGNNRGWDGTHMKYGRQCKQDVYVYKFAIHVNLGNDIERTGQVTLLK